MTWLNYLGSLLQQQTPYASTQVSRSLGACSTTLLPLTSHTAHVWPLQKRMRENFPNTNLLTSRSVNHGLSSAKETNVKDPACQSHIANYLKTGIVGFTDGTVCEASALKYEFTWLPLIKISTSTLLMLIEWCYIRKLFHWTGCSECPLQW